MAARLKVMQARVEPQLLFGVLAEVRDLYKRAPSDADGLLDDLIAYLRAALPQMRGDASTLGREAMLAVAYLKVVPAGRDGRLVAETLIPPELGDLPFPPMVLLPLVQAAAESSISRVSITVDGSPQAAPTGVAVRVGPPQRPAGWSDERLAPLRATLAQYFGPQSRLHVGASGGRRERGRRTGRRGLLSGGALVMSDVQPISMTMLPTDLPLSCSTCASMIRASG
jgi:hypothetical protein